MNPFKMVWNLALNFIISFLFTAESPYNIFFIIHSVFDGCLGCFQYLAIVTLGGHRCASVSVTRVVRAASCERPISISEPPLWFPQWLQKCALPPTMNNVSFPISSSACVVFLFLDLGHFHWSRMKYQSSFILYFPEG